MTDRVALLHERGVAATARGAPATGAGHLRSGLRLLGWPAAPREPPRAARLLISLAHAEAEQGRLDVGLSLLDEARRLVTDSDVGVCEQQRGLLLLRAGQFAAAKDSFDIALPLLADGHEQVAARTLLNRGVALQSMGRIALARRDFAASSQLASQVGLDRLAVKGMHNAGYCDYLEGDVPAALRAYAEAELALGDEPGLIAVVLVDRARAVLGAGLVREAQLDLERAVGLFAQQRLRRDQADAELALAQAQLAAGDHTAALLTARTAKARYARSGNPTGVALAGLAALRVQLAVTPRQARLARTAEALSSRLQAAGLPDDADSAALLGVRALVARGDPSAADLLPTEPRRQAPLELLLLSALARAELAVAAGRPDLALLQVTSALQQVQTARARLGSLDLQTGMGTPAAELARLGVTLAWQTGSARQVHTATELSRAQTMRIHPVRPVPDPRLSSAISELRQVRAQQRQVALSGEPVSPVLQNRLADLERLVRRQSWQTAGSETTRPLPSLSALAGRLGDHEAILVSLVEHAGHLGAMVVNPGNRRPARLVDLGPVAPVAEAARRVRADIDLLASRRLPPVVADSVLQSLRAGLSLVDRAIEPAVADRRGNTQLVVIPAGSLWLLPWGALPGLRGRPVTVAPSAASWVGVERAAGTGRTVIVGGPDLAAAAPEVADLAAGYESPTVLQGSTATVAAVLEAMAGAGLLHVAAHGEHDADNALFSRIWLHDGPLMAYDLQPLSQPPQHVVLASCDSGRAAVHPGDDLLGLAAAFLHAGSQTVVASVAKVGDESARRVMTLYHRALAAGLAPAAALSDAVIDDAFPSYVCFGTA